MKVELLKSIYNPQDYKDFGLPEFAFAGRSNAGKSTLINTLFRCQIAKVSKKPGKTQSINLYKVEKSYIIADLPGYGYAKVSGKTLLSWKNLVEGYIEKSKCLDTVFVLADVRRGIEEEELMLIDWLKTIKKNYRIIFTKIDKITKNELINIEKKYKDRDDIFFTSAHNGDRNKEILKYLGERCILKK